MPANPQIVTDQYGTEFAFYTEGIAVKFTSFVYGDTELTHRGHWDPVTAFNQEMADHPISLEIDATGMFLIHCLASLGGRKIYASQQDAEPGTWSQYYP